MTERQTRELSAREPIIIPHNKTHSCESLTLTFHAFHFDIRLNSHGQAAFIRGSEAKSKFWTSDGHASRAAVAISRDFEK